MLASGLGTASQAPRCGETADPSSPRLFGSAMLDLGGRQVVRLDGAGMRTRRLLRHGTPTRPVEHPDLSDLLPVVTRRRHMAYALSVVADFFGVIVATDSA